MSKSVHRQVVLISLSTPDALTSGPWTCPVADWPTAATLDLATRPTFVLVCNKLFTCNKIVRNCIN